MAALTEIKLAQLTIAINRKSQLLKIKTKPYSAARFKKRQALLKLDEKIEKLRSELQC